MDPSWRNLAQPWRNPGATLAQPWRNLSDQALVNLIVHGQVCHSKNTCDYLGCQLVCLVNEHRKTCGGACSEDLCVTTNQLLAHCRSCFEQDCVICAAKNRAEMEHTYLDLQLPLDFQEPTNAFSATFKPATKSWQHLVTFHKRSSIIHKIPVTSGHYPPKSAT